MGGKHCETCRFWQVRKLTKAATRDTVGFGGCEAFLRRDWPGPPSLEHVYVEIDDPWSPPSIYTGRKFGCIHWQEKE